jgi:hypothetical protein
MTDFSLMVKNILFEADVSNASNVFLRKNLLAEAVTSVPIIINLFYNPPNNFADKLESLYKTKYPDVPFPEQTVMEQIINEIAYQVTRGRGTYEQAEKIPSFHEVVPILDLICLLEQQTKASPSDFNGAYNKFEKQFKLATNNVPMHYEPIHFFVQNLQQSYIANKNKEIGRFRLLDDSYKRMSFYQVIMQLLKIRKTAMINVYPVSYLRTDGKAVLDKIFLEPWTIQKGTYRIPDEKLQRIYDHVAVTALTQTSIAAYQLFLHELQASAPAAFDKYKQNKELYAKYMGVNGVTPIEWNSL